MSKSEEELDVLKRHSWDYFNQNVQEQPRKVFVKFALKEVKNITDSTGVTDLTLDVYLRWFDPSLISLARGSVQPPPIKNSNGKSSDPKKGNVHLLTFNRTVEEYSQLWTPEIEINDVDEAEPKWNLDTSWNLKDVTTGEILYSQRYQIAKRDKQNLANFPFDSKVITLSIGCMCFTKRKVILELEDNMKVETNKDDKSTVIDLKLPIGDNQVDCAFKVPLSALKVKSRYLDEWTLGESCVVSIDNTGSHSHAEIRAIAHRNYSFYLYKVTLVNFMVSLWSWTTFFQDPSDFGTRMNLPLTLFLALVAFLFVVNGSLPKISYLTAMDKSMLVNFLFLFLVGCESFIAFVLCSSNGRWYSLNNLNLANVIDYWSALVFPSAYLLYHIIWIVNSLSQRAYHAHSFYPSKA